MVRWSVRIAEVAGLRVHRRRAADRHLLGGADLQRQRHRGALADGQPHARLHAAGGTPSSDARSSYSPADRAVARKRPSASVTSSRDDAGREVADSDGHAGEPAALNVLDDPDQGGQRLRSRARRRDADEQHERVRSRVTKELGRRDWCSPSPETQWDVLAATDFFIVDIWTWRPVSASPSNGTDRRRRSGALRIERRRQIEQPDELRTVTARVLSPMGPRERLCRSPRRLSLVRRVTQQHAELGDRRQRTPCWPTPRAARFSTVTDSSRLVSPSGCL